MSKIARTQRRMRRKVPSGGIGRTRRRKYKQTGTSSKKHDRRKSAKKPGWRSSKSGGYFENRRNRSDRSRKRETSTI